MLLPYASYLRAYEPLERLVFTNQQGTAGDAPVDTVATVTLAQEQLTVLRNLLAPAAMGGRDELAGCYVFQRDGRTFACAIDLALRCWLALASFVEDTDVSTQTLLLMPDPVRRLELESAGTVRPLMAATPHIRSATWGVPRSWFLLVRQGEREEYDNGTGASVRFRAPIGKARARLAEAHTLLGAMIGDEDLMDELDDLQAWLESFAQDGWLELDYAGAAGLLGDALATDRSAADIAAALEALRRRDFAEAGEAYRGFVERWRVVNALERAN